MGGQRARRARWVVQNMEYVVDGASTATARRGEVTAYSRPTHTCVPACSPQSPAAFRPSLRLPVPRGNKHDIRQGTSIATRYPTHANAK